MPSPVSTLLADLEEGQLKDTPSPASVPRRSQRSKSGSAASSRSSSKTKSRNRSRSRSKDAAYKGKRSRSRSGSSGRRVRRSRSPFGDVGFRGGFRGGSRGFFRGRGSRFNGMTRSPRGRNPHFRGSGWRRSWTRSRSRSPSAKRSRNSRSPGDKSGDDQVRQPRPEDIKKESQAATMSFLAMLNKKNQEKIATQSPTKSGESKSHGFVSTFATVGGSEVDEKPVEMVDETVDKKDTNDSTEAGKSNDGHKKKSKKGKKSKSKKRKRSSSSSSSTSSSESERDEDKKKKKKKKSSKKKSKKSRKKKSKKSRKRSPSSSSSSSPEDKKPDVKVISKSRSPTPKKDLLAILGQKSPSRSPSPNNSILKSVIKYTTTKPSLQFCQNPRTLLIDPKMEVKTVGLGIVKPHKQSSSPDSRSPDTKRPEQRTWTPPPRSAPRTVQESKTISDTKNDLLERVRRRFEEDKVRSPSTPLPKLDMENKIETSRLDMNADYRNYEKYYFNLYRMDAYSAAYYAQSAMINSGDYSKADLTSWLSYRGLSYDAINTTLHSQQDMVEGNDDNHQAISVIGSSVPTQSTEVYYLDGMFGEGDDMDVDSNEDEDDCPTPPAPPPPPSPPRVTSLIVKESFVLPNGQEVPEGTKQVIVHEYPKSHPMADSYEATILHDEIREMMPVSVT